METVDGFDCRRRNLSQKILYLRERLWQRARRRAFIENLAAARYRFTAAIKQLESAAVPAAWESTPARRYLVALTARQDDVLLPNERNEPEQRLPTANGQTFRQR